MTQGNQNQTFENLLSLFLQNRQTGAEVTSGQNHLDEDTLSAFVEGSLSEREAVPVLSHLVDCGVCRGISSQLARLATSFEEAPSTVSNSSAQTSQLAAFWKNLTQKVFNPFEDAVVAYKDDEKEDTDESEKNPENNAEEKTDR